MKAAVCLGVRYAKPGTDVRYGARRPTRRPREGASAAREEKRARGEGRRGGGRRARKREERVWRE
eukprot:3756492-Rhodomonas_salina.2